MKHGQYGCWRRISRRVWLTYVSILSMPMRMRFVGDLLLSGAVTVSVLPDRLQWSREELKVYPVYPH